MIHLHFQGKENLLAAAAEHASKIYFDRIEAHLKAADAAPQFRIEAMILCDLSDTGLTEEFTRITHELQAATRALPVLSPHSDTRDVRLRAYFETAFQEIFEDLNEDHPKLAAQDMTTAVVAMMEGLWVDFLLHPQDFDRKRAARIVFRTLAGLLPEHFDITGAK